MSLGFLLANNSRWSTKKSTIVDSYAPREQVRLIREEKMTWLAPRVNKKARWSMKEKEDATASREKNPLNHQKFTRCNKYKSLADPRKKVLY